MEFDMAYHHNLAVRRKNRLIVLMMLDSPRTDLYVEGNDTRAALRQYVHQYTYIDYMADDCIDKLLYALPLHADNPDDADDQLMS